MAKSSAVFVCSSCGSSAPRWAGRCAACGEWNTLAEAVRTAPRATRPAASPLRSHESDGPTTFSTGVGELDRVLGGGLVPGSTTLLFGEPGVGKSTLALMALSAIASGNGRALLAAAEESPGQIARRAARFGDIPVGVEVVATLEVADVVDALTRGNYDVAVVDSISALRDETLSGIAGSVAQVRNAADELCSAARASGTALVLVGHVTKDGDLSGPRALEHLVDTVIRFDGDRHEALRIISAVKHRFGSTGELGLMSMTSTGLVEFDPGADVGSGPDVPGVATTVVHTGSRSLLVEVQALVAPSTNGPRRVAHQLSSQRLAILLAVLEARCGVELAGRDVFAATAGGLPAAEPAADLALALAVASAVEGVVISRSTVAIGEVGLAGELRPVSSLGARVREAARRGAKVALVPTGAVDEVIDGIEVRGCATLSEALQAIRVGLESPVLW